VRLSVQDYPCREADQAAQGGVGPLAVAGHDRVEQVAVLIAGRLPLRHPARAARPHRRCTGLTALWHRRPALAEGAAGGFPAVHFGKG
jgi:hypothetical protein